MPLKIVLKLVYNTLLGGVVLILINLIGGFFSYNIALNFFTALVSGLLGLPGVILLVVLKQVFKV